MNENIYASLKDDSVYSYLAESVNMQTYLKLL